MRLSARSLDWALDHVVSEGDTDLFPHPFEFAIIKQQWGQIRPELEKIALETHVWEGPRRLLVPKGEFSFRPICQLDPIDSILFAAMILDIGSAIEKRRVAPSSSTVFSYRFQPMPEGRLYAATSGWEEFWKTSYARCAGGGVVLITDISDHYNQIYHHTIENQLDLCGVGKDVWHAVRNLIVNISEGVSRGIPIGPHPSHLIAEMAMIPVDEYLQSQSLRYCRYVDDIHIYCRDKDHAQAVLYKLADYLDRTQKVQLNKQKTRTVDAPSFAEMCVANVKDKPVNDLEAGMLKVVKTHSSGPYERISVTNIAPIEMEKLSQEKIEAVFAAYLSVPDVDYIRLRWFIRRLAQVGAPGGIEYIVKNFDRFLPAVSEVGRYLEASAPNYKGAWPNIGEQLIALYRGGLVQASDYLKFIVLSLFSRITDLNHINSLTALYDSATPMFQRKIVLAAGAAGARSWLSSLKGSYKNAEPWLRRAILYSLRALPTDERTFWLKSVNRRVDGLDELIARSIA